jgi:hypothetical protein
MRVITHRTPVAHHDVGIVKPDDDPGNLVPADVAFAREGV